MPHAIQIRQTGGPEVLNWSTVDVGEPGSGQVRLRQIMKYTFHVVDVFTSTPFGGNQLAVLPDAAGISTEGMQKIAREFNFGETAFVLPKNDPNTYRVRIFTPRTELDFAGHPSVGTACALVMKQHERLGDP